LQSDAGQTECIKIRPGEVVAGVRATGGVGGMAKVEVPEGNYIDSGAVAGFSPCPDGSLGLNEAREVCTACDPGTTSFNGYRCDACAKGKFGTVGTDDQTGFKIGECKVCPEGWFQDQDKVNSIKCKECPTGWSQKNQGSQSCEDDGSQKPEDCKGSALYLDDTSENPADWSCGVCPYGASCEDARAVFRQEGDKVVAPLFGFYGCPAGDEMMFEPCTDPAACPGGAINDALVKNGYDADAQKDAQSVNANASTTYSCAEGRVPNASENLLCATCVSGYMPSETISGLCVPCGEQGGAGVVMLFLCIVLASLAFLFLLASLKIRSSGRRKAPHSSLKRTLLTHIQTLAIVLGLNINWPRTLQSFLTMVSSMSNFAGSSWSMLHCAGGNILGPGGTPQPIHRAPLFYGLVTFCALLPIALTAFLWVYWLFWAPKFECLRCGRDMETQRNGCCGGGGGAAAAVGNGSGESPALSSSSNDDGEWELCEADDGEKYLWNATTEVSKWLDDSDDDDEEEGGGASQANTTRSAKRLSRRSSRPVRSTWDAFVATMVLFMYLLLPNILRTCFAVFECKTICGGSYLNMDYAEKCYVGRHLAFATAVASPGLILYGGVLPVFVLRLLRHNKELMKTNAAFMFRWGLMFSGFSTAYWWWEGVIFLRKLASILIVTFMRDLNAKQLHVALGTLVLFLHFQHAARPYDERVSHQTLPSAGGDGTLALPRDQTKEEEQQERHRSNSLLHRNEVYSLCVLSLTIWSSAFFGMNTDAALGTLLSLVVIGSNMAFILGNVIMFIIFFGKRNALQKKMKNIQADIRSTLMRGRSSFTLGRHNTPAKPAISEQEMARELEDVYPPAADCASYFPDGDTVVENPAVGAKLDEE
jgi:hypothetical protein